MTDNFLRPYSLEHIIKLWVDECTGKFIDPITVTDAVITKHGKTLTEVLDLIFGNLRLNKDLLNDLKISVEDLERYKEQFITLKLEFDSLKYQINTGVFAKQSDLECLRNTLEALRQQLSNNNALFTQLLAYLMGLGGQSGQGGTIDIGDLAGYLRTDDLLNAIRALNKFTENIKSELTGVTYYPENGLTTLPPTVGGALYVGDTNKSNERFYFTLNGDVDGNGYVTAADITALYDWMLNNNDEHLVNPDVFPDGHITAADITKVYDILLNGPLPLVNDKVTGEMYYLPIGTIFVNKNYVYKVDGNNLTSVVGVLYNLNANYYALYAPSSTYNTFNGPGNHVEPLLIEPIDVDLTPAEIAELYSNLSKLFDNDKIINPTLVAAMIRESNEVANDKVSEIEEAVDNGTFDISSTDYEDVAINLDWKGTPLKTAQGLVFLRDGNTLYVEPLGSFMDFKRITSDERTDYIDIVLCDSNGNFDTTPIRFDVKTLASRIPNASEDAEFGTIYAENEANDLAFCWIGAHPGFKGKPVVISYRDFLDYFNSINLLEATPGN